MINRQQEGDFAEVLCALSLATGLAFGDRMEHGLKSAYLGLQIADALALSNEDREAIFYGMLLKDVGCTACSAGIAAFFPDDEQVPRFDFMLVDPSQLSDMLAWLSRNVPIDARFPERIISLLSFMAQCGPVIKEAMRGHCEVAELFARQLGFPEYVQQTLRLQWERWDGKGLAYGLKGNSVPITARILHVAQVLELMYCFGGPSAAQTFAQKKRLTRFDPEIVDAFLSLTQQKGFWKTFDQSTQETILEMRPPTTAEHAQENQTEYVCEALADFVDIKTRETWHHSRIVAEVAIDIGKCLGLEAEELIQLRCAALTHDLGKVAIPIGILTKGKRRSKSEWETYYLHPYYTQRILEQVKSLHGLSTAAAAHHEWVNGQGYHRQLSGKQIPLHGRILAVADTYTRLIHQQGKLKEPKAVLKKMHARVGTQFDVACFDALVTSLNEIGDTSKKLAIAPKKNQLTDREREVLHYLAQGNSTPQIAKVLDISKKTVEHHLTHIYNKIGVTCRTSAVVYAVQQGLV